jgi:hypothetical protein
MEAEGLISFSQEPTLNKIISQINPVHTLVPHFFKVNFNIIPHPQSWFVSSGFPAKVLFASEMKYKFRFSVQFFENVSIVSPLTYMGIA